MNRSKYSKYYVSVDEKRSVLLAVVGEKIVVRGSVFHAKMEKLPNGYDVMSAGAPVIDQLQIYCDIHTAETWLPKVETKQFVPDVQGNFEFEIDTASYAPGMYYLWVFYTAGEDPANLSKSTEDFDVLSQQEADALKTVVDKFLNKFKP